MGGVGIHDFLHLSVNDLGGKVGILGLEGNVKNE